MSMSRCPENSTSQSCGLIAAQFLVEGGHIVLEPYDEKAPIKISMSARSVMEVLNPQSVEGSGIYDVATFGCAACKNVIQIIDDGDLSAKLVE